MVMIKYTPEQHEILDHIGTTDGILMVSAGAGAGKSFMAQQVVNLLNPKKCLYTAFNKAIVKEGEKRFKGYNVECKTFHALAYKFVNPRQNIEDLTYTCITENITYTKKSVIINAINMFFVSASTDMYEFMEEFFDKDDDNRQQLIDLSIKYIELMVDGSLNPTFNFLLKYFHLMLVEGTADCEYDLVILDEINDTTAVALEIFKLIKAPKKLGLGESNQAIYKFLNLVNGFDELSDEPLLRLTQSFRCGEEIAADIQKFMQKDVSTDFKFVGTDTPVSNGKTLFCTLTNALIIKEINNCLMTNKGFKLLRNVSDIFACPLALISANKGKEPYQKKYKFLLKEYEYWQDQPKGTKTFFQYLLENVDDEEIQNAVKLLMFFRKQNVNLYDVYKRAKEAPVNEKYTIATVFTAKGLEYENVYIGEDLNTRIELIRDDGGIKDEDDLVAYRCYYVACSRAGTNLYNASALYK